MRVLPASNASDLEEDRDRLREWAPKHGWESFGYTSFFDLIGGIRRLAQAHPGPLETIEVNAHGSPFECDAITVAGAESIGSSLRQLPGFDANTEIYLSGCNTGL